MAQDNSHNDLGVDFLDFSPEKLLKMEQLDFDLFEPTETPFSITTLDTLNGAPLFPGNNGTVSPQDIFAEPLSAPPSAAMTNMSTPGTTFESPYGVHSTNTSPLMDELEDEHEGWSSLFPGEQSPADGVQSSIEDPLPPSMSRNTSSSGRPIAHTAQPSSVVGINIKPRRREKPLTPILKDASDTAEVAKRKRNTEAARKSRAKRQSAMEALQSQVDDLQYQVYHWRTIAETGLPPPE